MCVLVGKNERFLENVANLDSDELSSEESSLESEEESLESDEKDTSVRLNYDEIELSTCVPGSCQPPSTLALV